MTQMTHIGSEDLLRYQVRHSHQNLGMPELNYCGLSESWLVRRAGHMHWDLMARTLRVPTHQIVDQDGERLYAAFLSVQVDATGLVTVGENDAVDAVHTLQAFSPPYAVSETTLFRADHPGAGYLAKVTLLSTFIRRAAAGDNRQVAKSIPRASTGATFGQASIHALRRQHRALRAAPAVSGDRFDYAICPELDLNGAGFLYFAAFVDIAKRAEARFAPVDHAVRSGRHAQRLIAYYGNENADAQLAVSVSDKVAGDAEQQCSFATDIAADRGQRLLARSILRFDRRPLSLEGQVK